MPDIDLQALKLQLKDAIDHYPDLDEMVADGRLIKVRGGFIPTSQEAYDAVARFSSSIELRKDGKALLKIRKLSKKTKAAAQKL